MDSIKMLLLSDRALRKGVKHIDHVIREGNKRKHLQQFAIETNAYIMVRGKPTRSVGKIVFKTDEFESFLQKLE